MSHPFTPPADFQDYERRFEQAREDALKLREQAIGDFWRGADAVWQRGLQTGQAAMYRSATRLKARLARHRASRACPESVKLGTGKTQTGGGGTELLDCPGKLLKTC